MLFFNSDNLYYLEMHKDKYADKVTCILYVLEVLSISISYLMLKMEKKPGMLSIIYTVAEI